MWGKACSGTSPAHPPPIQTAAKLVVWNDLLGTHQEELNRTRGCFVLSCCANASCCVCMSVLIKSHLQAATLERRLVVLFHSGCVSGRARWANLTDSQNRKPSVSTTNTAAVFRGLTSGRWRIRQKLRQKSSRRVSASEATTGSLPADSQQNTHRAPG